MKQARSTSPQVPRRPRWLRVASALVALAMVIPFTPAALAAPTCIDSDNPCEPNKLCTFKAQLAEKVFIYQTLLRNSQVTRRSPRGRREGIRYDGKLYDAAVSEAKKSFPNDSAADPARSSTKSCANTPKRTSCCPPAAAWRSSTRASCPRPATAA